MQLLWLDIIMPSPEQIVMSFTEENQLVLILLLVLQLLIAVILVNVFVLKKLGKGGDDSAQPTQEEDPS